MSSATGVFCALESVEPPAKDPSNSCSLPSVASHRRRPHHLPESLVGRSDHVPGVVDAHSPLQRRPCAPRRLPSAVRTVWRSSTFFPLERPSQYGLYNSMRRLMP